MINLLQVLKWIHPPPPLFFIMTIMLKLIVELVWKFLAKVRIIESFALLLISIITIRIDGHNILVSCMRAAGHIDVTLSFSLQTCSKVSCKDIIQQGILFWCLQRLSFQSPFCRICWVKKNVFIAYFNFQRYFPLLSLAENFQRNHVPTSKSCCNNFFINCIIIKITDFFLQLCNIFIDWIQSTVEWNSSQH